MADEKTRREFLQNASLAGAAIVAGAAALSTSGCADKKQAVKKQVDFIVDETGNGTLIIQDEELAKQIFEQLEKHGELTGKYRDVDKVKKTRETDTKGSPKAKNAMSSMSATYAAATAGNMGLTPAQTEDPAGITVQLEVPDREVPNGKVIVNSLCGCR